MHYIVQYYQSIIQNYKGEQPLIQYLKTFFSQHKQLGKRDRKAITDACFIFYRAIATQDIKAIHPLKIVEDYFKPLTGKHYWNFLFKQRIEEDTFQNFQWNITNFSKKTEKFTFSEGFTHAQFVILLNQQPKVFYRYLGTADHGELPEHHEYKVKISEEEFKIYQVDQDINLLNYYSEKEIIIQDLNSQLILINACKAIQEEKKKLNFKKVWDGCAGAGGKTLLLQELITADQWWATDIRPPILKELNRRLQLYGRKVNRIQKVDLSSPFLNSDISVDLLILDVPCSGSGTWGRTPERKSFFTDLEMKQWTLLQSKILENAASTVLKGGYIIYMTCSVFKEENEEVVNAFLKKQLQFTSLYSKLMIGIKDKADTLYVHVLKHEQC